MKTVCFRDFEERDIDFVYKCKNDEKLNSMIVGHWHPFTYDEAVNWVRGCMGEHDTYKFWAVATNDEEKRIIGWVSLSEIDHINKSVCYHGIVIGDREFMDGSAWVEANLFILYYTFEVLKFRRMYGSMLTEHKTSISIARAMFLKQEGILRQAVYKHGRYFDTEISAILADEYFEHKMNGEYEYKSFFKRLISKIRG